MFSGQGIWYMATSWSKAASTTSRMTAGWLAKPRTHAFWLRMQCDKKTSFPRPLIRQAAFDLTDVPRHHSSRHLVSTDPSVPS